MVLLYHRYHDLFIDNFQILNVVFTNDFSLYELAVNISYAMRITKISCQFLDISLLNKNIFFQR